MGYRDRNEIAFPVFGISPLGGNCISEEIVTPAVADVPDELLLSGESGSVLLGDADSPFLLSENVDDSVAEVTQDVILPPPLVYDHRVGEYISTLAAMELDDQDISEYKRAAFEDEEEFRANAGFRKTME